MKKDRMKGHDTIRKLVLVSFSATCVITPLAPLIPPAYATQTPAVQTPNEILTVGQDLITAVREGGVSVNQASQYLSTNSGLSINDSTQLLTTLTQGNNLNIETAGNVVNNYISGAFNTAEVSNVIQIASNLQNLNVSSAVTNNLMREVLGNDLSTAAGAAITSLNALGSVNSVADLQNFISRPEVISALDNMLASGATAQQLYGTLDTIANLAAVPEFLDNIDPLSLAGAMNDQLQAIAPAISQQLGEAIQSIPNLVGIEVINLFERGTEGLQNSLANFLSENSQLDVGGAKELLESLAVGGKIDMFTAGEVVNNVMGGNIPLAEIGGIVDIAQNLQAGNIDQVIGSQLVQQVVGGVLPTEVGQVLSTLDALGEIRDLADIQAIIGSADIVNSLTNMLGAGATAEQVAQALGAIGKLAATPEILANFSADQIAQAITGQLDAVAPGLANALTGALGAEALSGIVGGVIGGALGLLTGSCGAACNACKDCPEAITNNHETIRVHFSNEMHVYEAWFTQRFFLNHIVPALRLMGMQLVNNGMQKMQIIGTFFDAKHQLESQRLFQVLTAEAHKDYHPSENLCVIGTNTRYMADSARRTDVAHAALHEDMMARQLNLERRNMTATGNSDIQNRTDMFVQRFCNPKDAGTDQTGITGLSLLCEDVNGTPAQMNADVDYSMTIENRLSMDVDFVGEAAGATTPDEEALFALSANLFAHEPLPIIAKEDIGFTNGDPRDLVNYYVDLRAMAAKRSVAQNSFAAIAAMRTQSNERVGPFLKAIMEDAGIGKAEIEAHLGANPSLFAQEEVMMKTLYQMPEFYAHLYDKPANVERMGTALLALEIVQDRNIYESLLRSEAVLATLVETLLLKDHREISSRWDDLNLNTRRRAN
jgi:hypothetical protein